jgi:hypothetical protein
MHTPKQFRRFANRIAECHFDREVPRLVTESRGWPPERSELRSAVLRASLALLVASSAGCGLPLTPEAISCGTALGLDVYVDGISRAAGGSWIAQPAMSCATALAEVVQARDLGASSRFWPANQAFSGQLEFLNEVPWTVASDGKTEGSDMQIDYGVDGVYQGPQGSTVLLVHEMTHMLFGQSDHCRWATKFAPAYAQWQAGDQSGFTDECEHVACQGAKCAPVAP